MHLNHIAILTHDFESSLQRFSAIFGKDPDFCDRNVVEDQGGEDEQAQKSAGWGFGPLSIWVVEPIGPGSLQRTLEKRGEGFTHLGFEVGESEDFDKLMETWKANNVEVLAPYKKPHKRGEKGRYTFVDPKFAGNILMEFEHNGHVFA